MKQCNQIGEIKPFKTAARVCSQKSVTHAARHTLVSQHWKGGIRINMMETEKMKAKKRHVWLSLVTNNCNGPVRATVLEWM